LSNPKALSLPLISPFAAFLRRELPILDAEEWTDPSRLGVGVVERERGEAGSVLVAAALGVASSRVRRALGVTLLAFTVAALSLTGVCPADDEASFAFAAEDLAVPDVALL